MARRRHGRVRPPPGEPDLRSAGSRRPRLAACAARGDSRWCNRHGPRTAIEAAVRRPAGDREAAAGRAGGRADDAAPGRGLPRPCPAMAPAADAPERAAGWAIGAKAGADDPLLASLVLPGELLERPTSAEALTRRPAARGRPADARAGAARRRPRRARRPAGAPAARRDQRPHPALHAAARGPRRLRAGRARRASGRSVALPETGVARSSCRSPSSPSATSAMPCSPAPSCGSTGAAEQARRSTRGSWFWGTLAQAWPIYGEVAAGRGADQPVRAGAARCSS